MKKARYIIVFLLIFVALCACGKEAEDIDNSSVEYVEPMEPKKPKKVQSGILYDFDEDLSKDRTVSDGDINVLYGNMHDRNNYYQASIMSKTTIKIDRWTREKENDDIKFYKNLCVVKAGDVSNDFQWIDDEHSAFSITMFDRENDEWNEYSIITFTVNFENSKEEGSNVVKKEYCYEYQPSKGITYYAIPISDSVIKLERWEEKDVFLGTSLKYQYDVGIIDEESTSSDFEWFDEEKTGFTCRIVDEGLENGKIAVFNLIQIK